MRQIKITESTPWCTDGMPDCYDRRAVMTVYCRILGQLVDMYYEDTRVDVWSAPALFAPMIRVRGFGNDAVIQIIDRIHELRYLAWSEACERMGHVTPVEAAPTIEMKAPEDLKATRKLRKL